MPVRVWIQTQKNNVQKVKSTLEEAGQLSKAEKVKFGGRDGYMIIPTNIHFEDEVPDEAGCLQVLQELHLSGSSQCVSAEIVYLPSIRSCDVKSDQPKPGPIQEVISEWLQNLTELPKWKTITTTKDLLETSPKRWSIYEPMLLLPSGSFQTATWQTILESLDEPHLTLLWTRILHTVWKKEGGRKLTHLAINCGIPAREAPPTTHESQVKEPDHPANPPPPEPNILRTPSGLILLHGDFGPPSTPLIAHSPSATDFSSAFWVSSMQNGIVQTWAPRYTMFSRGNIKEKVRLLGFHEEAATAITDPWRRRRWGVGGDERQAGTAVDLYAGIGYFAFSYVAAGFGSVFCWELNPWSVEGLRRGSERNGWGCRVVRGRELEMLTLEGLRDKEDRPGPRLVVFEESNEHALDRIQELREWQGAGEGRRRLLGDVVHINCGLLPSSRASWRGAWGIVTGREGNKIWLHLHDNVAVYDVERRRGEIEGIFRQWAREEGSLRDVEVEHVELVKTFAPGVWHCVFDVLVQSRMKAAY